MRKYLFLLASLIPMLFGCKADDRTSYLKTVTGKAGEIIVVLDKASWDGEVGTALRDVLAKDYPMLPQREPSFTLINITKNAFSDLFKAHRNIVFFNIAEDVAQPGVFVKRNRWAQPQIILTIEALSSEQAAGLIKENADIIFNAIDQIEKDRIANSSKKYEEKSIRSVVSERFGGSPYFPKGYSIKKVTENFFWASHETTTTNLSILIYTIPYNGDSFPTKEQIIEAQDKVLKENVPGMFPNSYMITVNTETEAPIMTSYKYKNKTFVEIRGLWEVANDYMGGPFVEHVMYHKDPGKLIVIQGFVYAPKHKKRNFIRQVESIVYSFDWAEKFSE